MIRRLAVASLLLFACSRDPRVPVDTLLWRLGEWRASPASSGVRKAPAAFISFRRSGEFITHLCPVIEQPDTSVYMAANSQHVVMVGTWKKEGREIVAAPRIVWRSSGAKGPVDPLCAQPLRFTVSGNSVIGTDGQYSPVTRLVSPDFENYIDDAKKKGSPCPQPSS